ncbi:MAG: hypothetical protein HQ558_04840 [Candidatus Omnitrophica bacterium]|nr:hypothetical protein [Candidatus Omnitrophota bacterium]
MKTVNLPVLYSKILRRPFVLIIACAVGIFFCLVVSRFFFSAYVAKAKVMVISEVAGEGLGDEEQMLPDRILNTIREVIRSRDLAKDVVKELNLQKAFGRSDATSEVFTRVKAKHIKGTDIIEVSGRFNNAELATLVVNTLCKVVVMSFEKERFSFEKDIVSWLSKQTIGIKKELEDTRTAVQEFKESIGVADLEAEYSGAMDGLTKLEGDLSAIKTQREELKPAYEEIKVFVESGNGLEDLPPAVKDSEFKQMQVTYKYDKAVMDGLLAKYQPSHPKVAELSEKLAKGKIIMDAHGEGIIQAVQQNYKDLEFKEKNLSETIGLDNKKVLDLEQKMNEYQVLLDNVRDKEAIYDTFLDRIKKEFVGGLKLQKLSLIEQAYIPQKKQGFPTILVILAGLVIGVIISTVYGVIRDKDRLLIERTKVPEKEGPAQQQPKAKGGMYIERVGNKDAEQEKQE